MRFTILGSGSRGNATLIEHQGTHVLLDNGFSLKELGYRLLQRGVELEQLDAVLVTHEHNDHIGGVGVLHRKTGVPIWLTPGTRRAGEKALGETAGLHELNCHEDFSVGAIQVHPFPVPHDAREPCQFVFSDGDKRLGILTDVGRITQHIQEQLSGCDALILESNHDPQMLRSGPYPPSLQARVGGPMGHLSNQQAAACLQEIDCSSLQHIVAAHLSEKNNSPYLAALAMSEALDCTPDGIALAEQQGGLSWRAIQ